MNEEKEENGILYVAWGMTVMVPLRANAAVISHMGEWLTIVRF